MQKLYCYAPSSVPIQELIGIALGTMYFWPLPGNLGEIIVAEPLDYSSIATLKGLGAQGVIVLPSPHNLNVLDASTLALFTAINLPTNPTAHNLYTAIAKLSMMPMFDPDC